MRSARKDAMLRMNLLYSNHVQSDIKDIISALKSLFFFPLHMSTILNLLVLDTLHYGLILMIISSEGERPLEDFLSLIILVLTSLAIPKAPLYIINERLMGGESL